MRALKITESYGQFVVETSAGVRTSGATLESALRKLLICEESSADNEPPSDIGLPN